FLDCDSDVLQRRYTESRRPHPLAPDRPLLDAIAEERRQVRWVRDSADLVIDTSTLSPHQFKQILMGHFALGRSVGTRLSVMSFSYRRGLPREADLVFDVRFLKTPHYVAELKPLTGRDPPVAAYVAGDPGYAAFMNGLKALIAPLLPRFDTEGKSYLTIAIGCTGGAIGRSRWPRSWQTGCAARAARSLSPTGTPLSPGRQAAWGRTDDWYSTCDPRQSGP